MPIRGRWNVLLVAALAFSMPFGVEAQELNGNDNFAPLARCGIAEALGGLHAAGSPDNGYAFSMVWFRGCVTDAVGRCAVSNGIAAMGPVLFEVIGGSAPGWFYAAPENADPDGDSDGTTLIVEGPPFSRVRL